MKCGVAVMAANDLDLERVEQADWSRPPTMPDHEVWRKSLALGDLVEPLGFDSIWSIEHFATPYGMCPNSLQFLAYWAGRTRRVDLGSMVVIAPWWHPVKMAQEIAMLDVLLQGRHYTIGLGRGLSPKEYGPLGVPQGEARQRYDEALDILRLAFTKERFSYDGKIFKIPEMSIRPQPMHRDLVDGAVGAFMTPNSRDVIARSGLGHIAVAGQSSDQIAAENVEFNRARREVGLPPVRPTVFLPGAYCAKTEKEAQKGFGYIQAVTALSNWHYGFSDTNPTDFANIPGYEQYAAIAAASGPSSTGDTLLDEAMIGTPDQLIERIQRYQKKTNCQEIVFAFMIVGSAPQDEIERSMRLFAEEVLPAVHDIKVEAMEPAAT